MTPAILLLTILAAPAVDSFAPVCVEPTATPGALQVEGKICDGGKCKEAGISGVIAKRAMDALKALRRVDGHSDGKICVQAEHVLVDVLVTATPSQTRRSTGKVFVFRAGSAPTVAITSKPAMDALIALQKTLEAGK